MREFTINKDPARGIHTVGWFESDGRMTVQVRQYIPDSFFRTIDVLKEAGEKRLVGIIPSALEDKIMRDSDGNLLDPRDPERQKRKRNLFNDIDYRKLRVNEGRV